MRFQFRTGDSANRPYRPGAQQAPTSPNVARPWAAASTLPRHGKVAARQQARATARHPSSVFMVGVIGSAALLAVAGCASLDADLAKVFRVEPVLSVTHAISSSPAYYTLGKYHDAEQAWGKAVDAYRKAVIIDTQHIEAYNALGVALARSGRYAEAEATLRQATAIAPDRAHVRSNLGYVLLLAGKPADAAAELALAVMQDPGNSTAKANLQQASAQLASAQTLAVAAHANASPPAAKSVATFTAPSPTPSPAPVAQPQALVAQPQAPTAQPQAPSVAAAMAKPGTQDAPVTAYVHVPLAASAQAATNALALPHQALPDTLSRLEVSNGNGVAGMAARVGRWLSAEGLRNVRLTNQRPFVQATTLIEYRSGHEQSAQRVARSLPIAATTAAMASPGLASDVRVLLGRDWVLSAACVDDKSCPPVVAVLATAPAR